MPIITDPFFGRGPEAFRVVHPSTARVALPGQIRAGMNRRDLPALSDDTLWRIMSASGRDMPAICVNRPDHAAGGAAQLDRENHLNRIHGPRPTGKGRFTRHRRR